MVLTFFFEARILVAARARASASSSTASCFTCEQHMAPQSCPWSETELLSCSVRWRQTCWRRPTRSSSTIVCKPGKAIARGATLGSVKLRVRSAIPLVHLRAEHRKRHQPQPRAKWPGATAASASSARGRVLQGRGRVVCLEGPERGRRSGGLGGQVISA